MIPAGASAVIPDREGNTAMHLCCKKGFESGVFAILSTRNQHTSQNTRTQHGSRNTPIQHASQNSPTQHATDVKDIQSTSQNTEIKPKTQSKAALKIEASPLELKQNAGIQSSTLSNIDTGMTPTEFIGGASYHPSLDDRIFPSLDDRIFPSLDDGSQYFRSLDDNNFPSVDAESESSKQIYIDCDAIGIALGREVNRS